MERYVECSNNIIFDTLDGYYYIAGDPSHTAYITEDEAIEAISK
jgi:hypothetical protein